MTMSIRADRELSGLVSRRFVLRTPHTTMTEFQMVKSPKNQCRTPYSSAME